MPEGITSINFGFNILKIYYHIHVYSFLYAKNKNCTLGWRDGVGETLYAWDEMKFAVLPLTSVNKMFYLHFLYLYTSHVSDILKSQLFFSSRPIETEVNSADCFPSLPAMKLAEIPTLLQSSVLSTVACLRMKFVKEEQ